MSLPGAGPWRIARRESEEFVAACYKLGAIIVITNFSEPLDDFKNCLIGALPVAFSAIAS